MAEPDHLVVFANGRRVSRQSTKVTQLSDVAARCGYAVLIPDFSFSNDPRARIAHLLALQPRAARTLVLVGASMGAYVSAMACALLRPQALFLMAPALYFPQWNEEPEGIPARTTVVHGWRDAVVPVERGQRFAQRHRAALHVLDAGHTLNEELPLVGCFLEAMLLDARG